MWAVDTLALEELALGADGLDWWSRRCISRRIRCCIQADESGKVYRSSSDIQMVPAGA